MTKIYWHKHFWYEWYTASEPGFCPDDGAPLKLGVDDGEIICRKCNTNSSMYCKYCKKCGERLK